MTCVKRLRARYPSENGLMGFSNPSSDGPVKFVSFCSVDTMFHIYLRYNPLDDRDYFDIAQRVSKVVEDYSGNWPGPARDLRYAGQGKTDECLLSLWFPGDIDLEDMVLMVDSIPELQTSGWLRNGVDALKERAGLAKDDLPFLVHYSDNNFVAMDRDLHLYRPTFFDSAWLSAAGGTLEFAADTTDGAIQSVVQAFTAAGAITSSPLNHEGEKGKYDGLRLRFHWNQLMKDAWASSDRVQEILNSLTPQLDRFALAEPS